MSAGSSPACVILRLFRSPRFVSRLEFRFLPDAPFRDREASHSGTAACTENFVAVTSIRFSSSGIQLWLGWMGEASPRVIGAPREKVRV